MFSHVILGSNDLERSKAFYDAIFAALGAAPGQQTPDGRIAYMHDGGSFVIGKPINGEPACFANGGTIGFKAASVEQASAWHDAGAASGGQSCEDPPGIRDLPFGRLFLAYLRDPDGNKLCVMARPA